MTAWLARACLNLRSPMVRSDLSNAQALHRRMMMLVPDDLGERARQQAGMLFRIDEEHGSVTALIQARAPLDPSRLPRGYVTGEVQVRDLAPMFAALAKGIAVKYRLTANASKRLRVPEQHTRGPVIALRGAAAEDWWRRKAQDAGLTPLSVIASPIGAATGEQIRHDLMRFDGVALIANPELTAAALLAGIGRGKSYGAGLLSLVPARLPS
jgi:CRISPR system Cascade subunit CasE